MGSYFFLLLLLSCYEGGRPHLVPFWLSCLDPSSLFSSGDERSKVAAKRPDVVSFLFSLAVFASRFWFFPSLWLYASLVRSHRCLLLAGFTSRIFFSFLFIWVCWSRSAESHFLFSLFSESHRRKQPNSDLYYRTYMFRYKKLKKASWLYFTHWLGILFNPICRWSNFPPPCSAKAWKSHWPMHVSKRSPRFS